MNGIKISKSLRDELPENERDGLDETLWHKSGGKCFLCGEDMNRASEALEADHDQPASVGGATTVANLNLVHRACNRIKKNHPTINVRPFLRFQAFVRKKGGHIRYDAAVEYFHQKLQPSIISIKGNVATFEFPDNTKRTAPVYSEVRGSRTFRYSFVDVPQAAIFNDDKCQPRALKLPHVWSILSDLQINPLHEPPACRVDGDFSGKPRQLLMFDGQHKTIAYWLREHDRIVTKIYFGMDSEEAITLVNSIQSKIKKLPLSPFELAAKLSDEWEGKLRQYEASVAAGEVSEKGFIDSFKDPAEKRRAREAWQAALVQRALSDSTLELRNYVQLSGGPREAHAGITENTAKKKVLEKLLHMQPLTEKGEDMAALRDRELQNIVRVLNQFTTAAFDVGGAPSAQAEERMKRMMYQSSLQYCADLLKQLVAHVTAEKEGFGFLKGNITSERWKKIEEGIQRIVNHLIWTADLDHSVKTKRVGDALQKNQDAAAAFEAVGLRLGYVIGADKLKPSDLD